MSENRRSYDLGILLFLKYPEPGKVKSRLSAEIGENTALAFYQCFVVDTLATLEELGYPIVISFSPYDALRKFQQWLGDGYLFLPAKGETFGERLRSSFENAFDHGFERVVLVASDNPDVPKGFLVEAVNSLSSFDVVLGPCEDGGYYLLGFTQSGFSSRAFDDISWSTMHVVSETIQRLQEDKRSVHLLPLWYDIDRFEDVQKFYRRNKGKDCSASQTMAAFSEYLQNHKR